MCDKPEVFDTGMVVQTRWLDRMMRPIITIYLVDLNQSQYRLYLAQYIIARLSAAASVNPTFQDLGYDKDDRLIEALSPWSPSTSPSRSNENSKTTFQKRQCIFREAFFLS